MSDRRAAILARCDQLGTLARATIKERGAGCGQWLAVGSEHERHVVDAIGPPVAFDASNGRTLNPADAAHIATWDPAAVLALVAGAREMVALHAADSGAVSDGWTAWCGGEDAAAYLVEDCPTLAALARMLGVEDA